MAGFDSLRAKYQGYSDDEILGALQATKYPDYSIEEISKAVGYEPRKRSLMAVANDTVIEAANATAGAVGSAANFIAPGNRVSKFIDENIVRPGEASQSDVAKLSRRQFQDEVEAADGIGGELMAVGRKVLRDPLLTAAQAAGSFAIPGAAVKAAGGLAGVAGAGAAGVARAGLAGGAVAGGALAGGDAAGTAYDLVIKAGGSEQDAIAAARQASAIPAAVGALGGVVGAERLLAGAGGVKGGIMARALKTAGIEGLQEGFEEGITQYEGQRAAVPFDSTIDPMKGVGAAAGMGAAMGGGIGLAAGALSRNPEIAAQRLATADNTGDMIQAAEDLAMAPLGPVVKPRAAGADTIAEIRQLDPAQQSEAIGLLDAANNPNAPGHIRRYAQNRLDELLAPVRQIPVGEVTELPPALPVGEATELDPASLSERLGRPSFTQQRAIDRGIPTGDATELIPAGEASEVPDIPVGDLSYIEPESGMAPRSPRSDAVDIDPAAPNAVAAYIKRVAGTNTPAARAFVQDYRAGRITDADVLSLILPRKSTEPTADQRIAAAAAQAPTIQPGDLLTADGMPYGTRSGAAVRATREGAGTVIEVPGGYVVRKENPREPVADLAGTAGRRLELSNDKVPPLKASSVPNMEGNDPALRGSEPRVVQEVRGTRGIGVRGMAPEFRDVRPGDGAEANAEAFNRSDSEQQGLRAGQLPVGNGGRTGPQSNGQPETVDRRDSGGGSSLGIPSQGDAGLSAERRLERGESDINADPQRNGDNFLRANKDTGGVGERVRDRGSRFGQTDQAELAAGTSLDAGPRPNNSEPQEVIAPGVRVNFDGKAWTVIEATPMMVKLDDGKGTRKAISPNSKKWAQITNAEPSQPAEAGQGAPDAAQVNQPAGAAISTDALEQNAGPRNTNESDQDRSNREWRENFDRVVNAPDLNAISTKDIERAINYADSRSQYEKRKGWDGSPTNEGVIEGLDREIENLTFTLKQRQTTKANAQPTTSTPRVETPTPPTATSDAGVPAATSGAVEADGLKKPGQGVVLAVYQATESPGYEGLDALSLDDADFEIEALQTQQERGKLRPDALAQTEFGKRLDGAAINVLNGTLRADPAGTLQALRDTIATKRRKAPNATAPVEAASTSGAAAPDAVAPAESLKDRVDAKREKAPAKPAAPLYASRPVTNAADIMAWAASQGFTSTLPAKDLHVTVAYSREPVAGIPALGDTLTVAGGKRTVEPLGDEGAVVLKFTSPDMQARWKQYRDAGASWDYESYTPHVTITYDGKGVDLSKVVPYSGPIELGAEKQEPLNVDKDAGEVKTAEPKSISPKLQAVKDALARKDKPLDALAAKLDGPEMSARPAFTGGRRVVRVVNLKKTNSALSIVADGDGFKVVVDNDMGGGLREKIAARLAEMSAANAKEDGNAAGNGRNAASAERPGLGDGGGVSQGGDAGRGAGVRADGPASAGNAEAAGNAAGAGKVLPDEVAGLATHKDPGEPAEAVTPAVVADAIKTGVQATDRKPSVMKAELLARVDELIAEASDEELPSINDLDLSKDTARKWMVANGFKTIEKAQEWLTDKFYERRAAASKRIGYRTVKIEGDGTFTILNTKQALQEFRAKVDKSPGFKDRGTQPSAPAKDNPTVERGSGTPDAAIKAMIDDGDPQAAVDYAAARGLAIADVLKGDKARLPKVAGVTPTAEPVGEFEPDAPAPADDRRRKTAEYVRQAVTKRTDANSAMVWQIIGPDGNAVSGPPGKYPGNDGPLAGSATMGNLGWKTKREAEAALAELNRKADEILGAAAPAPQPVAEPTFGAAVKRGMTVAQFDAWAKENATRQPEQFAKRTEGVGLFAVTGENKGFKQVAGVVGSRTVADDTRDMRVVYRLDDGRLVWWRSEDGNAYEVAANDPRLTVTMPAPKADRQQSERTVLAGTDDEASILFAGPIEQMDDAEFEDELSMAAVTPQQAEAFRQLRKPAPQAVPTPAAAAEPDALTQTFQQWTEALLDSSEYKDRFMEAAGGDRDTARILAANGDTDTDNMRRSEDIARTRYWRDLMGAPRDAVMSLEAWDALPPNQQVDAQRHFFGLEKRIDARQQQQLGERVDAENAKKAPYEAALAEVEAEIRRLDKAPGLPTKKQNELSARRERLREAIYQIGQGKEPDGRLIRAAPAEAQAPAESAAPAPMPGIGGISMSLAQQAHSGTSFSPERRAEQERDSFTGALRDAWDRAARIAGTDPAAIERITEVFTDVADGYRARYTATLQARSRVMSAMIAGPARFPVERNRKRMETERKRADEASEYLARGIKRLIRAARGPIDNSPESELERVRLNLSQREELQETMKAANAALRKDDDAALEDLGFTTEQIADLKKGSKWERGFPAYRLTNNSAEIRRLRERLQSAEERMQDAAAGPVETERQGVKIVEDATDDRLRLIFDGKPSEAVREDLKANGFKWSPKNEAWQRQLTDNARRAARAVLDKHYPADGDATVGAMDPDLTAEAVDRAGLDATEVSTLEAEYGAENGTAPFHERLAQDVATYISQGAQAIGAAIRSIVGKVAKAVLSIAVVFNVAGLNPQFSSESYARTVQAMPKTVTVSETVQFKQAGKADFNGRALSANAAKVANWIGAQNRPSEVSLILDPATGLLYVMKGGKIEADSPALYGKQGVQAITDAALNASVDDTTDDLKMTPAGRFKANLAQGGEYGSQIEFLQGQPGTAYAIHRTYLGDAKEVRQQRLDSASPADNGISFGCVNVGSKFYDQTLSKLAQTGDVYAYMLPSDAGQLDALVPTPDNTLSRTESRTFTEGGDRISDEAGRGAGDLGFADRRRTTQRNAIRRRTDDAGNVAMFSRMPGTRTALDSAIEAKAAFDAVDRSSVVVDDADAYFALSDKASQARDKLVDELVAQPDDGFVLQGRTSGGRLIMLNGSAQNAGQWQLTRFDGKDEPLGDSQYTTKAKALEDFLREIDLASLQDFEGAFSRKAGRGVPIADAEAVAAAIREANPTGPQIVVLDDVDKAPDALLSEIEKAGAANDIEGAYFKGTIYLFPQHVSDIERLMFVGAHHEIRHAGLDALFGKRKGVLMLNIGMSNPAVMAAAKQKIADGNATSMVKAVEEALADMPVDQMVKLNGWDKIVAAVRTWLRELAAKLRRNHAKLADMIEPEAWTDKDVAALIQRAEDISRGGKVPARSGATMFGRTKTLPAATNTKRYQNLKWQQATEDSETAELGNGWVASIYQNEDGTAELSVLMPNGTDFGDAITYDHIGMARLAAPGVLARRVIEDGTQPGDSVAHIFKGAPDDGASGGMAMFSRATMADAVSARVGQLKGLNQQKVRDTFADLIGNAGAKVSWWDKTLGTQFAKAEKIPAYKRVFERVQSYIEDVSTLANEAADQAPTILPKLETWKDLRQSFKQYGMSKADTDALAGPVFAGTLSWTRDKYGMPAEESDPGKAGIVWTDAELKDRFKLNADQIKAYRQFLAATNVSLDQVVAADVLKLLGDKNPALREIALADRKAMRAGLDEYLTQQIEQAAPGEKTDLLVLRTNIRDKYERIDQLKARGYAPLMRFGEYKVYVSDPETGESLFFGLYESKAEANRMARDLAGDPEFKGKTIEQGVLSAEQYKLFSAMPVESLEMFAGAIGAEQSEVFQAYLRLAKNNRSALKRLIHRKGTAGYSEDIPRVLASFVTSNSRLSAASMNLAGAKTEIESIRDGDVKDEAIKLVESVQNPTETAAAARSLMFMNFIGGSIASAVVNLTQPITMTLPYLSQFGGFTKAGARLMAAGKMAASGKIDDAELKKALKRAEEDGTVSPQEIHHLQAQAMGSWGTSALSKQLAFIWGAPFSLAEQFNRRVTFIAAYKTAQEQGIADPFEFAERAVTETQGLYNKGNRPNWARNPLGATALQFKQFSIHYLEWMGRMWNQGEPGSDQRRAGRRAVLIALAMLMAAAGTDGLPFADDLDDLIDTIGQAIGYNTNSKKTRRDFVAKTLGMGDMMADVFGRGLSALPGVPLDVSLRMSMGNLIPASGILLRSNTDRSRDLLEVAGPMGGLVKQYLDSGQKGLSGDVAGAMIGALPVALQNVGKAISMWTTGEARDMKGNKVMAADEVDGLMRFLGFNPQAIARESEKLGMIRRGEQLAKNVEGEIAAKWARGFADGDQEAVKDARQELADWNTANPDDRIVITSSQILQRVKKMRQSRADRFITSVSPERRTAIKEAIQ